MLKRCSYQVGDAKASIRLTGWGASTDKIQVNKSYQFVHLSVRSYNNKKYLNMNKDSKFTTLGDIPNVVEVPQQESTIVGNNLCSLFFLQWETSH
jgi:hypothetical protein